MIIQFWQCHETNYKKGRSESIQYIVIHYTANNGDTAKNNVDYYGGTPNIQASAHYYCDEGDIIYQSVKDGDTAWAVGGTAEYIHPYCRNANSISIEMCSRNANYTPPAKPSSSDDSGWYIKPETISNAVELTKILMKKYNIPIENVIRHHDVWGKVCPAPFVNEKTGIGIPGTKQWEDFKKRLIEEDIDMEELKKLQEQVNGLTETVNRLADLLLPKYGYIDENMPDWARPTITKLYNKGFIKGDENGNLQLSYNDLRYYVVNDRAGIYS